jgi:MFS family permease
VLLAGVASLLGTAVADLCLTWLIFTSTGSALDVGYFGASALIGGVAFSLVGGTLADRHDRRRLMVAADLGRAAAVGALFVDLELFGFQLGAVLVAAFVLAALNTLFQPAEQAAIPQLVAGPEVGAANAVVRSSRGAAGFVGAAVGGVVLVAAGPAVGVGVNVVTFTASALLLWGLVLPATPGAGSEERPSLLRETREGMAYLRRELGLLLLTISATFLNFFQVIVGAFLVVYVTLLLHGSALLFGGVVGAELLGSMLGAYLAARVRSEHWAGKAWVYAYGVGGGICALLLGLVPPLPVVLAVVFLLGLLGTFAGTSWLTAAQRYVPTEMQGRYFGIDNLGSIAILPVGLLAGGWLIEHYQVGPTYLATGIVWLAVGLLFLLPRSLNRWGSAPDAAPPKPRFTGAPAGPAERILFPPGSP